MIFFMAIPGYPWLSLAIPPLACETSLPWKAISNALAAAAALASTKSSKMYSNMGFRRFNPYLTNKDVSRYFESTIKIGIS